MLSPFPLQILICFDLGRYTRNLFRNILQLFRMLGIIFISWGSDSDDMHGSCAKKGVVIELISSFLLSVIYVWSFDRFYLGGGGVEAGGGSCLDIILVQVSFHFCIAEIDKHKFGLHTNEKT